MANLGSQQRVFHYKQPLKSEEFNRLFSKTLPTGIYDGGGLERVSSNQVIVRPLSVIIEDSKDKDVAVRIRTLEPVSLTIEPDADRCILAMRYTWEETEENYLEFIQVSEIIDTNGLINTSLWKNDLIIGKIIFSGTSVSDTNSFDYTRAHKAFANPEVDNLLPLLVVRSALGPGNEKKVYVDGGRILATTGLVSLVGQYSPIISDTISNQRWDYVYLDENGVVRVQEGSEASDPKTRPFYGRKVLATIKRGPGRTDVKGGDIFGSSSVDRAEIKSTTILVKDLDTSEVFARNSEGFITIDMAIRELWNKAVAIENRSTLLENNVVYKEGIQTISGVKTFAVLPKYMSAASTPLLASDESHPITKKYYENTETGTGAVRVGTEAVPINQNIFGVKTFLSIPKIPIAEPTEKSHVVSKQYYDDNTVKLTGAQTISDEKTFNTLPKVPTADPTADAEVISKKFLEGNAKILRLGTQATNESQDVYGVKTFKSFPKVPTVNPTDATEVVSKGYLDGNAPVLRIGNPEIAGNPTIPALSEAQDIYGVKTFKALPKFNDGTNPLVPITADHPITKKHFDDNTVKLTGEQTIADKKIFSTSPSIPDTPAHNVSAINKNFLASASSNVVHRTGTESIDGLKTFTSLLTAAGFNASSSRKLKENISDYDESALDIVKRTKIVRYSYINDPDSYSHIGFIAEDTPEILTGKTKDTMAISDVCGILLKAVQELSEKIEILEQEKN